MDERVIIIQGRLSCAGLIEPELATLLKEPPAGDAWLHEMKLDGYRMLCRVDGGKTRMFSRGVPRRRGFADRQRLREVRRRVARNGRYAFEPRP